jgi:TonB-dependent receptor
VNKSISLLLLLPAITFISNSTLADKPLEEDKPVAVEAQESSDSTAESSASEDSAMSTMTQTMSTVENQEMEEVVTTGIKSSLMDALEIKRNKIGVTEIITAEDVGKFPDGNIAEALARVSGIAIDRSNIEGSQVTVRGMGAQYNMVTLNGRQMPVAPGNYDGGRAYDFGAISSHGISRLEVYKTQNPALPSGGLGATINMVTAKPLETDNGGSFSALMMQDTTSVNGDETTPEFEFINSYKSNYNGLDWGVSVSGSYHYRTNREEGTNEMKWLNSNLNTPTFGPNVTDNSGGGINYRPQSFFLRYKDNERTRKNLATTFQVGNEKVVATIDYVYSGVDFSSNGNMFGSPLDIGYSTPYGAGIGMDNVTIDSNGVVTNLDIVGSGTNITQALTFDEDKTSNKSLGLNIKWNASDALTFSFDYHSSSAGFKGGNNDMGFANGSWSGYGDGQSFDNGNPYNQWAELTNLTFMANNTIPDYVPTTSVGFQGFARTVRDLEGVDMTSTTAHLRNNSKMSQLDQYQIIGKWENLSGSGSLVSIDFGYSQMDQTFTRVLRSNTLFAPIQDGASPGSLIWGPNFWTDSHFTKTSLTGFLGDSSDGMSVPYYMHIDYDDAVAGYSAGYWTAGATWDCDEGFPNCYGDPQDGARVDETTESLFIQAEFEGEFNTKPWKLVTSLRYEELGLETPQDYGVPTGTFIGTYGWGDGPYFQAGPNRSVTGNFSSNSEMLLPSFAFSIAPTDETVIRLSAGKTLARETLEKFSPNIQFPQFLNMQNPVHSATSGNAGLDPLVSTNLDLAFEYYYAEGSYVAVNFFKKDLEDFVGSSTTRTTFDGLHDVRYGLPGVGPADTTTQVFNFPNMATIDQYAFGSMDWWQTLMKIYVATVPGTSCTLDQRTWSDYFYYNSTTCVQSSSDLNPLMQFDVTRPENIYEGSIDGMEFALQHFFVGTNFGVIVNYTSIGGDTEASPTAQRNQSFELAGFGDSGNLSVFYEDNKVSARLSNNYRAETYVGFDEFNPLWVEARSQIDFSASYAVSDKTTLFVEGLNITDEEVRLYARYDNMLFLAQNHGPVYKAGFRVRF